MIENRADPADSVSANHDAALSLASMVGRLQRALRRSARDSLAGAVLPQAQIEVLRLLNQHRELRTNQVSTMLGLASNTASTLIQQLIRSGYIERRIDNQDRRSALLSLTDAACQRIERWRDTRGMVLARTLDNLGPEDRQLIMAALPALERLTSAQESSAP